MNKFLNFLALILLFGFSFGQDVYHLDSVKWEVELPKSFYVVNDSLTNGELLFQFKKEDPTTVSSMMAAYVDSPNMQKLTSEVYVYYIYDYIKKSFNSDDFEAEVKLENLTIDGRKFNLIHSFVRHKETEFQYVSDLYFSEVNGKELNITIMYDNDEDKVLLEKSLHNSKFL